MTTKYLTQSHRESSTTIIGLKTESRQPTTRTNQLTKWLPVLEQPELFDIDDIISSFSKADPDFAAKIKEETKAIAETYYANEVGTFRKARLLAGYTQSALGQLVGLPQSHISKIEKGEIMPHPRTIKRMAEALNIRPGDLLEILLENDKEVENGTE